MTATASQYALIANQWPELHAEAVRVEQCALSDPRTACFYARRTIELLVEWVYGNDSQLQRPWRDGSLADLIYSVDFRDIAGDQVPPLPTSEGSGKQGRASCRPDSPRRCGVGRW